MKKRRWILIIVAGLIILAAVFVIGTRVYVRNLTATGTCLDTDTKPFYDCNSYAEYVSKRTPDMKIADDKFVSDAISKTNNSNPIEASNSIVSLAAQYLSDHDYSTSMKRLNEALLIDPNNYSIYWIMATWYGKLNDSQKADQLFDQAMSIYDSKYDFNKDGRSVFVCDFALGKLMNIDSKSLPQQQVELTNIVKILTDVSNGRISSACLTTLADAQYRIGDKQAAKQTILSAKSLTPSIVEYKPWQRLSAELGI
ncbi:MAG: hypothetical protein NT077_04260 [Candidatus Taylorbacteria bacterium]|nr:hypothetical protein [Candidatus Taylorbacteria bacterium]